ncbi:hypothetical protein [Peterkaempfera sp. SMS 1(5)a]|uniref:hypothetical protein n=1 Tax=Peterkaempfera podocarpi TaxID=3232308 RepID=UPI00366D65FD
MKHRIIAMAAAMAAVTIFPLGTGTASAQSPNNTNPGCFQIENLSNGTLYLVQQTGGFSFPRAIGGGMKTQPSCAKAGDHVSYLDVGVTTFTLTVNSDGNDGVVTGGKAHFASPGSNVAIFTN